MAILLIVLIAIIVALYFFTRKIDSGIDDAFTPSGHITPVTGGTIHWQKQGHGPALILIHGLLGNARNFSELANELAPFFTVYRVDRPGSGFSSRHPKTEATFEQQSAMLLEWMEKEGIKEAALAGHSMGGGISLRMALDAPERITSISLLCPLTTPLTGGAGPLSMLYIPSDAIRRSVTHTIASPLRVKFGKKQMAQIFAPEAVPADFAVKGGGILALHSRSFYEGSRDTVSAQGSLHRQQGFYDKISCPVGVLYGDMDTILNPVTHTQAVTEKLPHALAKTLKGAGHMIPITQPQACAEFIRQLAEIDHNKNQAIG
ncbi:alpha/beta fold hydrolase [Alteromonas sp. D210916BOD_24]|uniref:alpha/beta fold hydrolase n=1 Tax=Alteromonas sp. D210916BOD_24 TaxID=3157618 RepID=UPI00399D494D